MTRCCVEVSVSLRALVPNVSAPSAAIAIRMAERWTRYEQYSPYWQVRPRVSGSVLLRCPASACICLRHKHQGHDMKCNAGITGSWTAQSTLSVW